MILVFSSLGSLFLIPSSCHHKTAKTQVVADEGQLYLTFKSFAYFVGDFTAAFAPENIQGFLFTLNLSLPEQPVPSPSSLVYHGRPWKRGDYRMLETRTQELDLEARVWFSASVLLLPLSKPHCLNW